MARIEPTAEALAEFRGFFFGEGHIDIVRSGKGGHNLTPRVRIGLREDDEALLRWCVELFGGCLSRRAATRSVCWQLTGRVRVAAVISVLRGGVLPAKKRREVELAARALDLIRPKNGRGEVNARTRISPEVTLELLALRDEMKAVRRFQTKEA